MSTDTTPPAITSLKIPIIKKGEYDLWSMKMRQYISITDNALWDVILNGNKKPEEKEKDKEDKIKITSIHGIKHNETQKVNPTQG